MADESKDEEIRPISKSEAAARKRRAAEISAADSVATGAKPDAEDSKRSTVAQPVTTQAAAAAASADPPRGAAAPAKKHKVAALTDADLAFIALLRSVHENEESVPLGGDVDNDDEDKEDDEELRRLFFKPVSQKAQ